MEDTKRIVFVGDMVSFMWRKAYQFSVRWQNQPHKKTKREVTATPPAFRTGSRCSRLVYQLQRKENS